jgi:hypothetical protein
MFLQDSCYKHIPPTFKPQWTTLLWTCMLVGHMQRCASISSLTAALSEQAQEATNSTQTIIFPRQPSDDDQQTHKMYVHSHRSFEPGEQSVVCAACAADARCVGGSAGRPWHVHPVALGVSTVDTDISRSSMLT